jgi:hypothetical protein
MAKSVKYLLFRDTTKRIQKLLESDIEKWWEGATWNKQDIFHAQTEMRLYYLKDARWVQWRSDGAGGRSPNCGRIITPDEALVWLTENGHEPPDWLVTEVTEESAGHLGKGASKSMRRRRNYPLADDQLLIDRWDTARFERGITRQQFCDEKGIKVENLVAAQTRVRKHRLTEKRKGKRRQSHQRTAILPVKSERT